MDKESKGERGGGPGIDVVHPKRVVDDDKCGECGYSLLVFCDECRMAGSGFGGREKKAMAIHSLTVAPCCADALLGRDAKWGITVHKPRARQGGGRRSRLSLVVRLFGPETM